MLLCNRGFWGILALWPSARCPATYRDLLHQVDQIFFTGTERLLAILTHSVTGRTQKLLLKRICHTRPVANSISTTQFHLRKLSKWGIFLRYYFSRLYKVKLISYSKDTRIVATIDLDTFIRIRQITCASGYALCQTSIFTLAAVSTD